MGVAQLNWVVSADCTPAEAALGRLSGQVQDLNGAAAGVHVTVGGVREAAAQLAQVSALASGLSGSAAIGVDASGLTAAQRLVSGMTSDVRALGSAAGAVGSSFRFDDGGTIRALSVGVADLNTHLGSSARLFNDSASGANAHVRALSGLESGMSSASSTAGQYERQLASVGAGAAQVDRQMQGAAASMQQAYASASSGGRAANDATGAWSALNQEMQGFQRTYDSMGAVDRRPGGSDGPPLGPPRGPGGGGGGGGGGRGGSGAFGGAFDDIARTIAPEGIGAGGLRTPAMAALALGAVGVMEPLAAAAAGVMAFNKVVQDVPALTAASAAAMNQFDDGIRSAAHGADAIGIPAFQKLGAVLGPAGQAVGEAGMAAMPQVLSSATQIVPDVTQAVKNLTPSLAPAIKGAGDVVDSVVKGVGNPQVAGDVTAMGEALQNPDLNGGIQGATTGVLHMGRQVAEPALAALGAGLSSVGGAGPTGASASGHSWYNTPVGKLLADHSAGILNYDQSKDTGGGFLPGMDGSGVTLNEQSPVGRFGNMVGSWLNAAGVGALDIMNGSAFAPLGGGQVPQNLQDASNDVNQRTGAFFSGKPLGSPPPPPGAPGPLPPQADQGAGTRLPEPAVDKGFFDQHPGGGTFTDARGNTITGTRGDDGSLSFDNKYASGDFGSYSYDPKTGLSSIQGQSQNLDGGFTSFSAQRDKQGYTSIDAQNYDAAKNKLGSGASSYTNPTGQSTAPGGDGRSGPPLVPGVQPPGGGGGAGGSAAAPGLAGPSLPIPQPPVDVIHTGNAEQVFSAPVISALEAQPGHPGMYTGIVSNQFGQPPVEYNAVTGKVTGIPGQPQPDSPIQGQWAHETSLNNASIDGRGPASTAGRGVQADIGNAPGASSSQGAHSAPSGLNYGPDPAGFATGNSHAPGAVSDLAYLDSAITSVGPAPGFGWGPHGEEPAGYNATVGNMMAALDHGLAKGIEPTAQQMHDLNQAFNDSVAGRSPNAAAQGRSQAAPAAAAPGRSQAPGIAQGAVAQGTPADVSNAAMSHAAPGTTGLAGQAAINGVTSALSGYNAAAQQATTQTHDFAQAQATSSQSIGKNMADVNALSAANQVSTQTTQTSQQAVNGLASNVNSAASSVTGFNQGLTNTQSITDATSASLGSLGSLGANTAGSMASVAGGMGGFGPSFGAVGTDLGNSMASGMASTQNANEAAGAAAASAGVDGATGNDGSDSHSPSRKMTQIGVWMGEGLIVGQYSMASGVSTAGASLGATGVGAAANAVSTFDFNNTLAGGFGAGLAAASNGVMPIAQDYGLILGYSWAENVVTGAQNVFESSQFQQVTAPKFGSALAQRNLGLEGLLPQAGSGAEVYQTTAGSAGHVTMTVESNPTIQVVVDGAGPMQVIAQRTLDKSNQRIIDTWAGGRR